MLSYKNGVIIPDATDQQYQTTESGTFSVQVDLGECSASGSIDLVSELFNSEINVDESNSIEEGETLMVIISSDAIAPEFQWFYNGELISNATTDTYEASLFGDYEVVITETSGCNSSKSYIFTIEEELDLFPDVAKIPNVISPNGDNINDTWVLPQQYVSGTNTEVMIMDNRGVIVFQSNGYQNNWPQTNLNINSINKVFYYIITTENDETKKGSITVLK